MLTLIESPSNVITLRWKTEKGELWIELTPSNKGIEIYCDGQGSVECNYIEEAINAGVIVPKFYIEIGENNAND